MKKLQWIIVVVLLLLVRSSAVQAEEYKNVEIKKLLTSTTASNGQPLSYLRTDHPEVTVLVLRVPPGGSTGWHQHPVPVYAYMLEGSLTVEMKDGKTYEFRKGNVILEEMNALHNGHNSGSEAASLVVFYTGETGVPNVIKEESQASPASK
ncbi:MAG: cupin domain-containing protein [Deltaproteobacteria bacterium]|nr:cupin domain-containing protein [Deltaproteobacteria bacterium]